MKELKNFFGTLWAMLVLMAKLINFAIMLAVGNVISFVLLLLLLIFGSIGFIIMTAYKAALKFTIEAKREWFITLGIEFDQEEYDETIKEIDNVMKR